MMRFRFKRRNLGWLAVLGLMVGAVALTPFVSTAVAALLIGIWGAAAVGSMLDFQVRPDQLIQRSRSSLTAMRMSTEARESAERARRRGGSFDTGVTLLDIGLITSQSETDGMTMRRTRDVSMDEDGVRPFIQVHVDSRNADRPVRVRFEMIDPNGTQQYVHEMRTFLRDGEMNLLADHHLPLANNDRISTTGDYDMRVYLDGLLIGAHTFTVVPSVANRFARLERNQAAQTAARRPQNTLEEQDRVIQSDDSPMSLEDLLRTRGQQNGSNNQGTSSK